MTWSLYTQYTAASRAIEAIIALFALFWAAWVTSLIGSGLSPMSWAGFDQAGQVALPSIMFCMGALHVTGMRLLNSYPRKAAASRFVGLSGMVLLFLWLGYCGFWSSAGPTYFTFAIACAVAMINAGKDFKYARRFAD